MMEPKFQKLLQPARIGGLEIKNRFVMPAMMTGSAKDGMPSEAMVDYYSARAKGGAGLIVVEFTKCETRIEPLISPRHLRIDTQPHQDGFTALTESVHLYGGKIALQISPGLGGWVMSKDRCPQGVDPVGHSRFAGPGKEARALSTDEVESIVQSFGEAALRAKKAGFDAVEIHGHSSYLLGQFMSPLINTRDDKYGNLWRLPVELLLAAKAKAGSDFPVIFRISGDEFIDGGRTVKGTIALCCRMEEAGIDCINVSDGTYYTEESNLIFPYMTLPRGTYAPECRKIREAVKVPLILAGRLSNPDDALKVVEEGIADFVGIGRGLIADPELPNKVAEGRVDEIRPCLSCNYCITSMMSKGVSLVCAVNAQVLKEGECKIRPATRAKKVMVIGGGPGGMEAARVAALRGHQVTLYEKQERLGGYLIEASTPEHKKDIRPLIEWLSSEVKKAGAKIVLGKDVDVGLVSDTRPDVVIVAVGAVPIVPEIMGIQSPNVVTSVDVLRDKTETGETVIVAGGGLVGCDVAMFLADRGKKVGIVEMLPDVALDAGQRDGSRAQVLMLLKKKGVTLYTDRRLEEITEKGVVVKNNNGERSFINTDTVVLSLGLKPKRELYEGLDGKGLEIYAVGDCAQAGKIAEAIHSGFFRGNTV
jgi:2,4-dienoyl-CoA reductase-like NADH-dependent reductase (Old Yellow Enzyme family)/thioredoxin reductase